MPSFDAIPNWVWWALSGVSVVSFVGSLLVLRWLIIRLPADHFASDNPPLPSWAGRHPVSRIVVRIIKNVLGGALICIGIVMLLTPGQGVLAILVGISLLDLPGKRHLERRIVANPVVLRALNSMRARAGRPPLRIGKKVGSRQ